MTENPQATSEQSDRLAHFNMKLLDAWVENRMEHDRLLIQLSAAGIGVLITLVTAVAAVWRYQPLLYLLACLPFLATILICLRILRSNADYLEAVCRGVRPEGIKKLSRRLRCLDKTAYCLFICGIGVALFAALLTTCRATTNKGEEIMPGDNRRTEQSNTASNIQKKSLNGIVAFRPNPGTPEAPVEPQGPGTDGTSQGNDQASTKNGDTSSRT